MPSACFPTIRLWRSWESSLVLPIMRSLFCDTLVMSHLFISCWFGLNQLTLICTKRQDYFLITDRFQLVSWRSIPFCASLSSCVQYFFPVTFLTITHNPWTSVVWCGFCWHFGKTALVWIACPTRACTYLRETLTARELLRRVSYFNQPLSLLPSFLLQ